MHILETKLTMADFVGFTLKSSLVYFAGMTAPEGNYNAGGTTTDIRV